MADRYQQEPYEPASGALYEHTQALNVSLPGRVISLAAGMLLLGSEKRGFLRALAGGYLLYRGISGNCPLSAILLKEQARQAPAVDISTSFTVNRPRETVYRFWRQLENLPRFMQHIREVREDAGGRSHWKMEMPRGWGIINWEAEIVEDRENAILGWRSVAGSMIENAGHITFRDAPRGGTEVHVRISYRPPAGYAGTSLARLLNPAFARIVREDVRSFKQFLETGERPTIKGQPSGRRPVEAEQQDDEQAGEPASQTGDYTNQPL